MKRIFLLISLIMFCCCDKPDTSDPITPPVAAPEDQKPDNGSQDQEEGALPMVIVGYATYQASGLPELLREE